MAKTKSQTGWTKAGAKKGKINPALAKAGQATHFKPGNPGRPPGSRVKLANMFIQALCDDFAEHGVEVLRQVREDDPSTYARVIAGVIPKEIEIKRPLAELSEDELLRAIEVIRAALGGSLVIDGTGVETTPGGEPLGGLPAIREAADIPPRW